MSDPEPKTIRGIVIPTDWYENGHPRSVAIATYREQKYLVAEGPKCLQLLSLLNERVVVSGMVQLMKNGMVIEIQDFYLDNRL
jgi:hypothetical protein